MARARTAAALAAAAVAAALALAGCGGSDTDADPGTDPGGGPISLPTPDPGPGGKLPDLAVDCSGGVAGVEERLVIKGATATGTHRYRGGTKTTKLTADEQATLASALRDASSRTYRPSYQTPNVWDVWQYRIQIGTSVVSADQLALPPQLADLVDTLAPVRSRLSLVC